MPSDCLDCGNSVPHPDDSLQRRRVPETDSSALARCAFAAVDCGFAVLKGRSVAECNRRWQELSDYGSRWRCLESPSTGDERVRPATDQGKSTEAEAPRGRIYRSLRTAAHAQVAVMGMRMESTRSTYECLGVNRFVELALGIVPGSEGALVCVLAYDVSHRIAMERELTGLRRALADCLSSSAPERFVSEIVHDVRNLIGALSLQLTLLERDPHAPQYRDALRRTNSEATAMLARLTAFAPRDPLANAAR